jgi:hypothetical protein
MQGCSQSAPSERIPTMHPIARVNYSNSFPSRHSTGQPRSTMPWRNLTQFRGYPAYSPTVIGQYYFRFERNNAMNAMETIHGEPCIHLYRVAEVVRPGGTRINQELNPQPSIIPPRPKNWTHDPSPADQKKNRTRDQSLVYILHPSPMRRHVGTKNYLK